MEKITIGILCVCLAGAGSTHIFDNIYFGLFPYQFAPKWINVYWSLLGLLDFFSVFLLLKYRNLGLLFVLIIMVSNVGINSFSLYSLKVISSSIPLQAQTFFFGVVIGVTPWLWKSKNQGSFKHVI
ncbi:hypothetical protein [Microbulbifer thermotolerans]|uniref:Uncharacterized protein n=1 Tax=Microbulbifer thermotolerans TaxID=252514 RepID=A0AB35HW18_MICTH|nr:hypothetical protein [Microbulbifer thermotolerans]MCX2801509.1 hypothetical protein [Microbulbifer thermotolerans]